MGKDENAKLLFSQITKYFLGMMGFFIVLITIWIDSIVRLKMGGITFFGEEYWSSTQVVPILLLGYYFFGFYVMQLPGVFLTNRTKRIPLFRGAGAVLMVVSNIILIPIFGILGAAYSKAFAYVGMALVILLSNNKYYKINYSWWSMLYPIIYMLIVILIPMNITLKVVSSILYIILWYLVVANKSDKEKINSLLK
jgi:O-antigen/teichoic acid export membrane protein